MTDPTNDDNTPRMPASVVELALWKKNRRPRPGPKKPKNALERQMEAELDQQYAACEEFFRNRVNETLVLATHYFDLHPSVFMNYLHMETVNHAIDVYRDDVEEWGEERAAPCYHDEFLPAIQHRLLEDSHLKVFCQHNKPFPGCAACSKKLKKNEDRIAKERADIRQAHAAYAAGNTIKDIFRQRLENLPRGPVRAELQRIFDAASENADEDNEHNTEMVFEMTVENHRDDADGEVREFLDSLLG